MKSCEKIAAETLVAIPVFNELKYLDRVLQMVRKYSGNILLVDDGSTDGTSRAVKKHKYLHTITHTDNKGYGRSLIDAINFACKKRFRWLITLDCDYQHEPSYIPSFYNELQEEDADIISGSRYLRPLNYGPAAPPKERVAINKQITNILNRNLGLRLTDAFCGFKALRTQSVFQLGLTEEGYGFPLQLWIRAARASLKIREIPVPLIYHDTGRNFNGCLKDPAKRLQYYLGIIEKEMKGNVRRDAEETYNP